MSKTAKQIYDLIKEANKFEELKTLIEDTWEDEKDPRSFLDMEFKMVERKREDEYMRFVFSIDGSLFEVYTNYDSWNGWDLETYSVKDMDHVEPVEVTKTVYSIVENWKK